MEKIQNELQFKEVIKGKAVVNFSAPSWCAPCVQFAPHYKAVAERVDMPMYYLDIDEFDVGFSIDNAVMTVPSVVYYQDGQEAGRLTARTATQLEQQINSL